MKVEKAGMGDIEALVKMRLCYLIEDNGSLDAQDLVAIKRDLPGYLQAHLDKDLFIYVIRDGQNIVSCAFLLIVEKPMSPAFINGRTGMVLNVYTCPSYRRKGCAKMIMEALISEAKKMEGIIDEGDFEQAEKVLREKFNPMRQALRLKSSSLQ